MVSINCKDFYLSCHKSSQMHMNMIISKPTIKIIKCNVNIAVYRLKSQNTSYGDFMYVSLGCYLPIQPPLKS